MIEDFEGRSVPGGSGRGDPRRGDPAVTSMGDANQGEPASEGLLSAQGDKSPDAAGAPAAETDGILERSDQAAEPTDRDPV